MPKKTLQTIFIFSIAILMSLNLAHATSAQEADTSPSAEVATDSATNNLKERIEKIVEEKKEDLEEKLKTKGKQRQGYIGEVIRVSQETIAVDTLQGNKIIPVDDKLTIIKKGKAIKVTDIAVGDWLIVVGIIDDDSLVAQRIIVSSKNLTPKNRKIVLGTISSVGKNNLSVLPRNNDEVIQFNLSKTTKIQDSNKKELTTNSLSEDIQCLLIAYQAENETNVTASTIHLLTTAEALKEKE